MTSLKKTLQQRTQAAVLAYNTNRSRLVKEAAKSGGAEAVAVIEEEYTALCNAAFALKRAALKRNHRRYRRLLSEATESVSHTQHLIEEAAAISAVLDGMAKAVTLLGRVLLLLG